MCFQRTEDLHAATTERLFHPFLECMSYEDVEQHYYWLFSLELRKLIEELKGDTFHWMKQEILDKGRTL